MQRQPVGPELIGKKSAYELHLGYRLTHWDEGYARLEQDIAPFLMNRTNIPHGGNYAALLDTAMGFAAGYTGVPNHPATVLTLSMNVSFLAVAEGDVLAVEGEVVGGGRKTVFAEARVLDGNGRVVARGSGTFQRREAPK